MPNNANKGYDLAERTALFGEAVIEWVASLPKHSSIVDPLIRQIVRSATSVGANYMEADTATSKKDFVFKIGLCRKEAKETIHWLRMVIKAAPESKLKGSKLSVEAHELVLIFSTIINNTKL